MELLLRSFLLPFFGFWSVLLIKVLPNPPSKPQPTEEKEQLAQENDEADNPARTGLRHDCFDNQPEVGWRQHHEERSRAQYDPASEVDQWLQGFLLWWNEPKICYTIPQIVRCSQISTQKCDRIVKR